MDWQQLEKADRADLEALALAGRELAEATEKLIALQEGPRQAQRPDIFERLLNHHRDALERWKEAGGEDE